MDPARVQRAHVAIARAAALDRRAVVEAAVSAIQEAFDGATVGFRSATTREAAPIGDSVIAAPVRVGPDVEGVLTVGRDDGVFEPDDLVALAALGAHLGAVIEAAPRPEQARAGEGRLRQLLDALPHAVYEALSTGEVVFVSSRIEALTGHGAERFARDPHLLRALVHPEDRGLREERLRTLARPGDRTTTECRVLHANGVGLTWVADHVEARPGGAGEPPIVLVRTLVDLGDRKQLEAASRETARLASLGELAAGVAHEVNNPLSGVLNYAQLAKRLLLQPNELPPALLSRLVEPLEGIVAEAERILEITRTLVSFARRPEQEEFRALSIHELVRASLTISKQRLKECSIALDVELPHDLPAVRARGHELTQVLQHLIANAHHALNIRFPRWDPQKRLAFRAARVDGDERHAAGYVRVEVHDRGAGIAPGDLDRVFVPFFTTRRDGSGLGLPASRQIVEAHGGVMSIQSAPGEGTVVSFTVPVY